MSDSFGMMEGAYFISKNELLAWMNELLKINLTKVEQLGTGAVYSQILDVIYPGEVALYKLNWKARLEWEFVNNFKVLQQAFQKAGISKYIDVAKLVKAKYQDNLEFGQWIKRFYELKLGKEIRKDYDPIARRGGAEPDFSFVEHKIPTKDNLGSNYVGGIADSGKRAAKPHHESLKKMVRMNNGDGKENKGMNVDLNEKYEKVKRERDSLQDKLTYIENLLNSQEGNDSYIVQNIRNALGLYAKGNEYHEEMGNGDEQNVGNEASKEVLMLIEGESI